MKPLNYTREANQINLAPTLLDYLGQQTEHPMIGHSLPTLPDAFAGRAITQYAATHANMIGDQLVIPVADKPGKQFVFEKDLVEVDPELIEIARAHALWPRYAYRQKKYLTALVTR